MSGSTPPSLDALRDIHLPPAPALLPPAEWLFIIVMLAMAAAAWYGVRFLRRRRLRTALRALERITASHSRDADTAALARGLSRLLRGYAMTCFPEEAVAGLTGRAWLQFLDTHGGNGDFCNGVGATLETLPYEARGVVDTGALVGVVRRWLKANPR